jgi:hypothetical protein
LRNQRQNGVWKHKIELYQPKIEKLSLGRYNGFRTNQTNPGEFSKIILKTGIKGQSLGTIFDHLLAEVGQRVSLRVLYPEKRAVRLVVKKPEPAAVRLVEVIGDRLPEAMLEATTEHVWLVVLGQFAQALGLVEQLAEVPLEQRAGTKYEPQTKLIEFLVGILGGLEYLQDLNREGQAIATDPTVAAAWGQVGFAHYSQVSRTLQAADEATLAAVIEGLRAVSRPFIQQAILLTLKKQGQLILDLDLTGREVSQSSTSYEGAEFGWMADQIKKGYQAAITSLVCEEWGRLLLTLQRYGGGTHSCECLPAAMTEAEEVLAVRPRRRVELVQAQRRSLVASMQASEAQVARKRAKLKVRWADLGQARLEVQQAQANLAQVSQPAQVSQRQRQLAAAQKRVERAGRNLAKEQQHLNRSEARLIPLQEKLMALDEWLAKLEADNQANPNPVTIWVRIDAGFSTGRNLAWLIELGYDLLSKAHHSATTDMLRQRLPAQATWQPVAGNAEAIDMGQHCPRDCPYPLRCLLVRYQLKAERRYTTLLYYGQAAPPALPDWWRLYNGRQTIEAGIKEEKRVFTLKRHLVQSPIGMQLQEQFALFGANFVRWTVAWVKQALAQVNPTFLTALGQVKTLVRLVTRCRARWVRHPLANLLILDEAGPFAGTIIRLSGEVVFQLTLPMFNFIPARNLGPSVAQ